MSMNSTAAPFDQAAGLRELFANAMPSGALEPAPFDASPSPMVHALVCPARPALVLPLAQVCVQFWRQQGVSHLWADELDLVDREEWPFACQLRFDLAQGLAKHVPLDQTLHALKSSKAYYAGARRLAQFAPQITKPLVDQLRQSDLALDHILVSWDPLAVGRPWSIYGAPVQPVLLCEATERAAEQGLKWLTEQQADKGLEGSQASVVFYSADPEDAQSTKAQTLWKTSWAALHGQPPAWMGHVVAAPDAGLSSNLKGWQDLASRWLSDLTRV
jgi:hypothetical protein